MNVIRLLCQSTNEYNRRRHSGVSVDGNCFFIEGRIKRWPTRRWPILLRESNEVIIIDSCTSNRLSEKNHIWGIL